MRVPYTKAPVNGVIRTFDNKMIRFDPKDPEWKAYEAWRDNGGVLGDYEPAPEPTVMELVTVEVQRRLDSFAQTRSYDGILSACSYATSKVPKFAAEAQYCIDARDTYWGKCYEILDQVLTGQMPMPTVHEALALLPPLEWPQ